MTDSTPAPAAPTLPAVSQVQVQTGTNQKISESELAPSFEGIFKGATTKTGMFARELTPETLIKVPTTDGKSMEITIEAAMRAGLVRQTEDGKFEEVQQGQPEGPKEIQRETLAQADEAVISELVQTCAAANMDHVQVVGRIIAAPDQARTHIEAVARATGADADKLMQAYEAANTALYNQRYNAVRAEGVATDQMDEFEEWVTACKGRAVHSAMLHQYARGTLGPWRSLAREFIAVRGVSGAMPQGVTERKTHTGQTFISGRINGQRIQASPQALRRAGLISIG